jgi:UDPglucose 6-dehydrogenase
MRAGRALHDFLEPSRVVIGSDDENALEKLANLYSGFRAEVIKTNFETAALIKYASNAFLALKISFINEIAGLANLVGGELKELLLGIGTDPRIGKAHLKPGPGWGGSCFPKDSHSLLEMAGRYGVNLLTVSAAVNANNIIQEKIAQAIVGQVESLSNERRGKVAMLGLAFKSGTDDTRESPAIKIGNRISAAGINVQAFDPIVKAAKDFSGDVASTIEDCVKDADLLVIMTEWDQFYGLDPAEILRLMRTPYVFDTRNLLDVDSWRAAGANVYPMWLND